MHVLVLKELLARIEFKENIFSGYSTHCLTIPSLCLRCPPAVPTKTIGEQSLTPQAPPCPPQVPRYPAPSVYSQTSDPDAHLIKNGLPGMKELHVYEDKKEVKNSSKGGKQGEEPHEKGSQSISFLLLLKGPNPRNYEQVPFLDLYA